MQTKANTSWQEEQALDRYQLIAPLLEGSLDDAKRIRSRKDIAQRNAISPRSLYRYGSAYRKGGFAGSSL